MNYYESTLNDLVMFSVLDITAFCMLNKVMSAFVLPRSSVTFALVSDEYPPKTSIMMLYCLMVQPLCCCLSSHLKDAYLVVFS